MLKIKTPNRKRTRANINLPKGDGFYVPPTEQLFDCKQPNPVLTARGPIIEDNSKRTQILTRRGPIVIPEPTKQRRRQYKLVPRNEFLPERQVSYSTPLYPYRLSEEEMKQARLADIERNGQLVQLSNKTLDRVFEKFDLLTISDDILKKVRTGQMSKKDARASAILALSKEVKDALKRGNKKDIVKAVKNINAVDRNLIPNLNQLGANPDEIKNHPALEVAVVKNNTLFDVDVLNAVMELIQEGKLILDPVENLINDIVDFDDLTKADIQEIEELYNESLDDNSLTDYKIITKLILDKHYGMAGAKPDAPEIQVMEDDPAERTETIRERSPTIDENLLGLAEEFEPQTMRERADTFYDNLDLGDGKQFKEDIEVYTDELLSEIDTVIKNVDMPKASIETLNKITINKTKALDIERRLQQLTQNVLEDESDISDVEKEVKKLTQELEDILNTISDSLGEVGKNPVDIVNVNQLLEPESRIVDGEVITKTTEPVKTQTAIKGDLKPSPTRQAPRTPRTLISETGKKIKVKVSKKPKSPFEKSLEKAEERKKREREKMIKEIEVETKKAEEERAEKKRKGVKIIGTRQRAKTETEIEAEQALEARRIEEEEEEEDVMSEEEKEVISPQDIEAQIMKEQELLFPSKQYDLKPDLTSEEKKQVKKKKGKKEDVWNGVAIATSSGITRSGLVLDRGDSGGKVKFKKGVLAKRQPRQSKPKTELSSIMGKIKLR
jgi:hypothetical protein